MTSPTTSANASTVSKNGNTNIDSLLGGDKWGASVGTSVNLTYSFPWQDGQSAYFFGYNGQPYSTLAENTASQHFGFNAAQVISAVSALNTWTSVANIVFTRITDTSANVGDIRFAFTSASTKTSTGEKAWGWTRSPDSNEPSAGDIWVSTASTGYTNTDWSLGSYNFYSLVHEIGHTLGLKHPFADAPQLDKNLDSRLYTVMSYSAAPDNLFVKVVINPNSLRSTSSIQVVPETPMLLDIAAIQYLYGANNSYKTGDDVYTFDTRTPFFKTIWDAGGKDTISVSNFTEGCEINLNAGSFSKITIKSDSTIGINWTSPPPIATYDGTNNLCIAYGAVIENATGGSGNDTLIGNNTNNNITGGAGNDSIDGGNGIDSAVYTDMRANCKNIKTTSGWQIQSVIEGLDNLSNVERLKFKDTSIALDATGNAGTAIKILGAVFGKSYVSNKEYVGIALDLLDKGMNYDTLTGLALGAANATTNDQIVTRLWTNLVGSAPSEADKAPIIQMLKDGMSPGVLARLAADTPLNATNINLVGLAQTGIEYTPVT